MENIPIIESNPKKRATVSFHLEHEEKALLYQKSMPNFDSVSEYIRYKLLFETAPGDLQERNKKLQDQLNSEIEQTRQLKNELKEYHSRLYQLQNKVNLYENDTLKDMFNRVKGQSVNFKSPTGKQISLTIYSLHDLYFVIINSFEV
jgi:hypothetical protein